MHALFLHQSHLTLQFAHTQVSGPCSCPVLGALRTRCELSLHNLCHLVDSFSPNSPLPVSQMTCELACEILLDCLSHFATRKIKQWNSSAFWLIPTCLSWRTSMFSYSLSRQWATTFNLAKKGRSVPRAVTIPIIHDLAAQTSIACLRLMGAHLETWQYLLKEGSLCFTSCSKNNIPSAGSGWILYPNTFTASCILC